MADQYTSNMNYAAQPANQQAQGYPAPAQTFPSLNNTLQQVTNDPSQYNAQMFSDPPQGVAPTGYLSGLTAQQHSPIDMGNGYGLGGLSSPGMVQNSQLYAPEDVNMGYGGLSKPGMVQQSGNYPQTLPQPADYASSRVGQPGGLPTPQTTTMNPMPNQQPNYQTMNQPQRNVNWDFYQNRQQPMQKRNDNVPAPMARTARPTPQAPQGPQNRATMLTNNFKRFVR
jgi:hypothetical protein